MLLWVNWLRACSGLVCCGPPARRAIVSWLVYRAAGTEGTPSPGPVHSQLVIWTLLFSLLCIQVTKNLTEISRESHTVCLLEPKLLFQGPCFESLKFSLLWKQSKQALLGQAEMLVKAFQVKYPYLFCELIQKTVVCLTLQFITSDIIDPTTDSSILSPTLKENYFIWLQSNQLPDLSAAQTTLIELHSSKCCPVSIFIPEDFGPGGSL